MTAPALWKVFTAAVAALACVLLGAYMLYALKSVWGAGLCVLGICIALPTPFTQGVTTLKGNLVLIVPIVKDAMAGGARHTDPPADTKGPQ